MEDLVSVVIPVYNVQNYLRRCLDSVIEQTYYKLQIILVNDGSIDDSGKICDEYKKKDKRIEVIHKENGGLSDARNEGIKKAQGKYITFIDSDDEIAIDYIEFLYLLIVDNKADMSICSHVDVFEGKKKRHDWGKGTILVENPQNTLEKMLYKDGFDVSAWAKMYPLSAFSDVEFPKGKIFEDAATTYKLIAKCSKIALGLVGKYYYYIRSNSIVNSSFSEKKLDLNKMTEEMCFYIENKYPELKNATERRRLYAAFSSLNQLYKCEAVDSKIEEYLFEIIKKNRKSVLLNSKATKIDKAAIIILSISKKLYKIMWKLYLKIFK